jgi:hypothetical protein
MAKAINEIVRVSKGGTLEGHKAFGEGAFLNHFVLPALYRFIAAYPGMDPEKARESPLSESYRSMRAYASGSPARSAKHPFDKVVGVSARGVIRRWKSARALIQSCPDIALRAPFPYRTVFEGKYLRGGGGFGAGGRGSVERGTEQRATGVQRGQAARSCPSGHGVRGWPARRGDPARTIQALVKRADQAEPAPSVGSLVRVGRQHRRGRLPN